MHFHFGGCPAKWMRAKVVEAMVNIVLICDLPLPLPLPIAHDLLANRVWTPMLLLMHTTRCGVWCVHTFGMVGIFNLPKIYIHSRDLHKSVVRWQDLLMLEQRCSDTIECLCTHTLYSNDYCKFQMSHFPMRSVSMSGCVTFNDQPKWIQARCKCKWKFYSNLNAYRIHKDIWWETMDEQTNKWNKWKHQQIPNERVCQRPNQRILIHKHLGFE